MRKGYLVPRFDGGVFPLKLSTPPSTTVPLSVPLALTLGVVINGFLLLLVLELHLLLFSKPALSLLMGPPLELFHHAF